MRYFAEFRFDEASRLLWRDGVRVPITGKAGAVLACLTEADHRVLTKNEILSAVWGDTHVTPDNIKVLIRELRLALSDNAHTPRFIRTYPRSGYEFIAPVSDTPPSLEDGARVFVGRSAELEAITTQFDAALAGTRGAVLILGQWGVGKTALCERALRVASQRGFMIARGECMPTSGTPEPYAPILDAVHSLLTDYPHVRDIIQQHAPALLHHLSDDLRPAPPHSNGRDTQSPRLLRESVAALERLSAEAPLVLALDDVQWLDAASIDVIRALGRRHHPARLCILANCRPFDEHDEAAAVSHVFDELTTIRCGSILTLPPLSHADIEQYVSERFDGSAAALTALLESASEGHPLLLTAAADAILRGAAARRVGDRWQVANAADLAFTVVAAVGSIMERRIGQLTREERSLLTSVSCLGLQFSLVSAARVTAMDAEAVERTLQKLAQRGEIIARTTDQRPAEFRFTNAMYLEVLSRNATLF